MNQKVKEVILAKHIKMVLSYSRTNNPSPLDLNLVGWLLVFRWTLGTIRRCCER